MKARLVSRLLKRERERIETLEPDFQAFLTEQTLRKAEVENVVTSQYQSRSTPAQLTAGESVSKTRPHVEDFRGRV
jgi:hypothetical protein